MAMDKNGKVRKVMGEFKDGKLQSGSGHKVTNRSQAMAIALKEAGINRKMFSGGRIGDGKAVQGTTRGRII
jgi:Zn-dependent metalloprotease